MAASHPASPTSASASASTEAGAPTPWHEFSSAFSANRGALVAFCVFAAVVVGALLAPWLAPHDPVQQFRDAMLTPAW